MTPPATALGRRTAWAVAWTAGARVMRAGVQVLYLLVLARMLSPSDFAVVAIALLAHQLVSVICTETVHQALVHDARWLEHDEVTGFWAQVFICGVTALVLVASGGAFASMLRLPDLIWLMPAIAVGAILAAPTAVPAAKLVAEMRFDRLAVIETTATLLSGIAAIVVALFGFGLASFVVFSVGMRLVEAIGLAASARWRPNGRFSLSSARSLAGFALPLLAFRQPNLRPIRLISSSSVGFSARKALVSMALPEGLHSSPRR
ncbi:oligosaccharide flippase family protein [Brevundimonas sp.]|uniref:oligosaccharide flippase family protein n=1 Tax=Brevundimonas sp. TaxID=1871086 RepID=UPI0025BD72FB|nr:oligosaccharide flippase family protein [Brevundimonas sp.]